ncbi:MAG: hypothetical protein ACKVJG_21940 [Candidatus Latescibacterota bacterium]|jgi:hypothetical protein
MQQCPRFEVQRLGVNPIIYPTMPGLQGDIGRNINGPSLICVPEWIEGALGAYYLYFADHSGHYIRLAYADDLAGPWTIYEPGVLHMHEAPGRAHIASPDVHLYEEERQIRLYFHQPAPEAERALDQVSYVALSNDGLHFNVRPQILGQYYFRVFQYGGWHYAFAKGISYRSRDGLTDFVEGETHLPRCRHTAVWVEGDIVHLVYSRTEDRPESILYTWVDLREGWLDWNFAEPTRLLAPELDWEGADCLLEKSREGKIMKRVNELRDPAIYRENGQLYLLYSVAGESGIAIAKLEKK